MIGTMFGVRLSSLFTSRWMALAWAILICLTAIEFAGGRTQSDNDAEAAQDAAATNAALAALN